MGYNYEILLEHKEGDEWKILEEYGNSGSYHSSNNHYFFNKFEWSNKIENYEREREEAYYMICINELKKDYLDIINSISDWKSKVIEYINNINCIKLLNEYVDDLSNEYDKVPEYFDELEKWYNIIKKYEERGYVEIRILYGYSA
jgi:hypothetical protein